MTETLKGPIFGDYLVTTIDAGIPIEMYRQLDGKFVIHDGKSRDMTPATAARSPFTYRSYPHDPSFPKGASAIRFSDLWCFGNLPPLRRHYIGDQNGITEYIFNESIHDIADAYTTFVNDAEKRKTITGNTTLVEESVLLKQFIATRPEIQVRHVSWSNKDSITGLIKKMNNVLTPKSS